MWASLVRAHCLEYRGFSDDPSSIFYLPEELTQKIYDASTNICDAGVLATVSKSGRQNVRDRMEHVLKLTQPPFNIPKNKLCNITSVLLFTKNINENHMITFATALANGALAKVTTLNLGSNHFGDAGLSALASACAKGALAHVTRLHLYDNQIGDAGLTALADACANGALAKVTHLYLNNNEIGDDGLIALADACAKGAFAQVTKLQLYNNKIGDAGIIALAAACVKGALASLRLLVVDEANLVHPALKAACQARGIGLQ